MLLMEGKKARVISAALADWYEIDCNVMGVASEPEALKVELLAMMADGVCDVYVSWDEDGEFRVCDNYTDAATYFATHIYRVEHSIRFNLQSLPTIYDNTLKSEIMAILRDKKGEF